MTMDPTYWADKDCEICHGEGIVETPRFDADAHELVYDGHSLCLCVITNIAEAQSNNEE